MEGQGHYSIIQKSLNSLKVIHLLVLNILSTIIWGQIWQRCRNGIFERSTSFYTNHKMKGHNFLHNDFIYAKLGYIQWVDMGAMCCKIRNLVSTMWLFVPLHDHCISLNYIWKLRMYYWKIMTQIGLFLNSSANRVSSLRVNK